MRRRERGGARYGKALLWMAVPPILAFVGPMIVLVDLLGLAYLVILTAMIAVPIAAIRATRWLLAGQDTRLYERWPTCVALAVLLVMFTGASFLCGASIVFSTGWNPFDH